MKKPTHLILDKYSHPLISLFWKRHGLSVMEHLVPNDFLFTTGDNQLEKLIEKEIWSGWKKIIIIGTPNSIRRSFNIIMSSSRECRGTLSFGFWPIDFRTLINYISKSSLNLRPILQVFKAGNTILVDVPKVQFVTSKNEQKFFWNNFFIKCTHTSSETVFYIDELNFEIKGRFTSHVIFHEELLNSLTMHPNKLARAPLLKVYIKKENDLIIKQKLKNLYSFLIDNHEYKEFGQLHSTGRKVEINGNWANLSLGISEIKDTFDSVNFAVERKSLYMIIPSKPIHTNESIRKIIPAFRPSRVIANNSYS